MGIPLAVAGTVSPKGVKTVNVPQDERWSISAYAPSDCGRLCFDNGTKQEPIKLDAMDSNESTSSLSTRPVFNSSVQPRIKINKKSACGYYLGGEQS